MLKHGGGNQFKLPHSGIRKRQHSGEETADLFAPRDVRLQGVEALDALQNQQENEFIELVAEMDNVAFDDNAEL